MNQDTIEVFAQYNEDVILSALLHDVKKGFYVDVGANHEDYHSVTKLFYRQGWHGINIEPIPWLAEEIKKIRKRDITLNLAVSNKKGTLIFREYPEYDGLSTFSKQMMNENEERGITNYKDYEVKLVGLEELFDNYEISKLDFLKIDVEGYEQQVLDSNNWHKHKPTVVCIEANHHEGGWSDFFSRHGYKRFIYDGLNEYFILKEAWSITDGFAERAAALNHNALNSHHFKRWRKMQKDYEGAIKKSQANVERLTNENVELNRKLSYFSGLRNSAKHLAKLVRSRFLKIFD